ncbi:tyrosine-type recombinase/integrase [candidate division CSSED10-310 bacterium]|uniref:Tyrosine-type recombinase/integrase n=1 Tax=candidate division CSSED10-310 bacterium TaxID=2855610 RepID=A0ABV6Z4B7_UNCC1
MLSEYSKYAIKYRDLSTETIARHENYLNRFFQWLATSLTSDQISTLNPNIIHRFVTAYAHDYGPGSQRWMFGTLRSFLRFLKHHRYAVEDFSYIVPVVRRAKLAQVPPILDDESIELLLDRIDRSTSVGIRDYSIIQLLSTYGIRGIQTRCLKLQDINWRKSQIHFPAVKGGNPIVQYLTDEVGNSLLDYLRHSRPHNTSYCEVFLTCTKPYHPFRSSRAFSSIIARRLKRHAINVPAKASRGSHIFRHAFASRMLRHGESFKHIADMLGHRNLNSTMIYAKVDFQMLREATLEWPRVNS